MTRACFGCFWKRPKFFGITGRTDILFKVCAYLYLRYCLVCNIILCRSYVAVQGSPSWSNHGNVRKRYINVTTRGTGLKNGIQANSFLSAEHANACDDFKKSGLAGVQGFESLPLHFFSFIFWLFCQSND